MARSRDFENMAGLTEKLIESSLDGIIAFDTNFNYTVFNPAMERILGMTKAEVLGRNAFETFPFLLDVGEDVHFKKAIQGKGSLSQDRPYTVPQTGRTGTFEALYSPLYDIDKNIIGGFGIIREVTEWKRTSRALKETEKKLETLNRVTSDAIITCNNYGAVLSWNKNAEKIFDYFSGTPFPKSLESILPSFRWQPEVKLLSSSDWPERTFRMDGVRSNGSSVPLQVSSSHWRFEDKVFLTLSIRDLTELNHIENQADEQRELSEAILEIHDALRLGLVSTDMRSNKPVFINQAYANIVGYTIEELMAMSTLGTLLRPDQLPLMEKRIANRIKSGRSEDHVETILMHKKGFDVYVDVAMKEIETSSGPAAFCIVRDITHRKISEGALRNSEQQLRFMFEKAKAVVCLLDQNGLTINLNPAFKKILKYSRFRWVGKPFCLVVHPDDVKIYLQCLKEASNPNNECETKLRLVNSQNEIINVEISATVLIEKGRISTYMLVIRPL